MAEIDSKEYFKIKKECEEALEELRLIREITKSSKHFEITLIDYKADNAENAYKEKLDDYKRYLLCEHSEITHNIPVGSDSHKDYYEDRCKKCKKLINSYSI